MGQTNSFDCCSRGIPEGRNKDDNQRIPLIPPPTADSVKNSIAMHTSQKVKEHFKSHENLFTRLVSHRQDHILANVDDLKEDEIEKFYDSLYEIDFEMMDMMYNHLILNPQEEDFKVEHLEPIKNKVRLKDISDDEYLKLRRHGLELILSGKVGVLLLSGGEGTSLGFDHPKGMLKIGTPSGKFLYEYIANKIARICQIACETFGVNQTKSSIIWYIMTNETNYEEITTFFSKNNYFGLGGSNLQFFNQTSLPALDFYGKIILNGKNTIHMAPNGTGGVFHALSKHGMLKDMKVRGIKYIHVIGTDNPLIKPADPFFIGYADVNNYDVTNKYITKRSLDEPLDVYVLQNGKPHVIQHSELAPEYTTQKDSKGNLLYDAGYILNSVYSVNFLEKIIVNGLKEVVRNYHVVKKKIKYYDKNLKETVIPLDYNAYTLQLFNYDAFILAQPEKFGLIEIRRQDEFCSIKNPPGSSEDNTATARRALSLLHQRWLEERGVRFDKKAEGTPDSLFEIDCAKIYDEKDPRFEKLVKKYQDTLVRLPIFIKE